MTQKESQLTIHALRALNRIARSDAIMGDEDIEDLEEARELLAELVGASYDEELNCYVVEGVTP